jgi:hypothetical protein
MRVVNGKPRAIHRHSLFVYRIQGDLLWVDSADHPPLQRLLLARVDMSAILRMLRIFSRDFVEMLESSLSMYSTSPQVSRKAREIHTFSL